MQTTICLHHNDLDGRASGAIVRYALGPSVQLYEIDYGDPIPWDAIQVAQRVFIVDFSLSLAEMEHIATARELVWIDHHISAMQELETSAAAWPGLRDTSEAACVLCWRYFFPQRSVPRAIVLVGDRDIWRLAEPDSAPFNEGLFQDSNRPDNDSLWQPLLKDQASAVLSLIERGQIYLEARLRNIRRQVSRYAYAATFEGQPTLVINRSGDGDMGHYMLSLGYSIAYCYIEGLQNDHVITFVTLYSDIVDVSQIAMRFGGGGHRGAAGFSFERGATPFPPGASVFLQSDHG